MAYGVWRMAYSLQLLFPSGLHRSAHLSHRLRDSDEYRPADDGMADVQFLDVGHGGDRRDVAHGESMTGVHGESEQPPVAGAVAQGTQRGRVGRRVSVPPGVQLDGGRAEGL